MSETIKQNHQGNGNLGTLEIQNKTTLWQDKPGLASENATRKLISHYNKQLFEYYLNLNNTDLELDPELESNPDESPPFLVVGLGRCGCHVTAELAEIIASNSARSDENSHKEREKGRKMLDLFRSGKSAPVLKFEPVLLIGDIDETAFQDVDGLLKKGGVPEEIVKKLLRLNYNPLAEGGVGHVPLFAEFITRGMLLLPTQQEQTTDSSWIPARNFLTNNFFNDRRTSRLVFYIFSTGGGSGSGSAAAMMKAQRYAMSVSDKPKPQIYFTGVAVMPENIIQNRRHLINTGRNIIQYLADLNISLTDEACYTSAPVFNASAEVHVGNKKTKMMPWDGLALISNDVMSAIGNETIVPQEVVESNTNQYIAQQMFNLAAAQFSAATFEKDETVEITKENYQAIRLDPQDLKNGLVGPYGICFGAATANQILDKTGLGLDKMFLRAIGLPKYYQSEKNDEELGLIEGISVAPAKKAQYAALLQEIIQKLETKTEKRLERHDFEKLRDIPVFQKCPRLVFVFTAPQESVIPSTVKERISSLLYWLFPSLEQVRGAIVRGTTAHYTLSIYIETSIILSPDIQSAVKNYLKLCWQQRRTSSEEFSTKFRGFIEQQPPISDAEITEWLGETEDYGVNIPSFGVLKDELNQRWQNYLEKNHHSTDNSDLNALSNYNVDCAYLKASEVAAALRFMNYANHFELPDMIID
jgi:predicted phosphoribosyltransferase